MFWVRIHASSTSAPLTFMATYEGMLPLVPETIIALKVGGSTVERKKQAGMTTTAKQAPARRRCLCRINTRRAKGVNSCGEPPAAVLHAATRHAGAMMTVTRRIHKPMPLKRPVGSSSAGGFVDWHQKTPQRRTSRPRREATTAEATHAAKQTANHTSFGVLGMRGCFRTIKVATVSKATEMGKKYIQAAKPTTSTGVNPAEEGLFVPRA
mmetsp:Transcript_165739/g.532172  ORF Transcript_165739/g.532172 Transcript_165739/m.532172 type:complete len:210 (-) Transcript_165739:210-839(-)